MLTRPWALLGCSPTSGAPVAPMAPSNERSKAYTADRSCSGTISANIALLFVPDLRSRDMFFTRLTPYGTLARLSTRVHASTPAGADVLPGAGWQAPRHATSPPSVQSLEAPLWKHSPSSAHTPPPPNRARRAPGDGGAHEEEEAAVQGLDGRHAVRRVDRQPAQQRHGGREREQHAQLRGHDAPGVHVAPAEQIACGADGDSGSARCSTGWHSADAQPGPCAHHHKTACRASCSRGLLGSVNICGTHFLVTTSTAAARQHMAAPYLQHIWSSATTLTKGAEAPVIGSAL